MLITSIVSCKSEQAHLEYQRAWGWHGRAVGAPPRFLLLQRQWGVNDLVFVIREDLILVLCPSAASQAKP